MKYDQDNHYWNAYGIMFILLIPFNFYLSINNFRSPVIVLFTMAIVGNEYSFFIPRKSLKVYEEIKFESLIERIHRKIRIALIIFFSGSEIYMFATNNNALFLTSLAIYMLWYMIFDNQSIILGTNSIIIGYKLVSYDLISKITFKKKMLIVEANGKSFKIYNWAIRNQQSELEKLKSILEDKVMK